MFVFQSIPWSKNKEKQDKRKSKKEVRKTKAEKRKSSDEIVDDFDDDIRLMKKLKKGKVKSLISLSVVNFFLMAIWFVTLKKCYTKRKVQSLPYMCQSPVLILLKQCQWKLWQWWIHGIIIFWNARKVLFFSVEF